MNRVLEDSCSTGELKLCKNERWTLTSWSLRSRRTRRGVKLNWAFGSHNRVHQRVFGGQDVFRVERKLVRYRLRASFLCLGPLL
jgi:hypothetical protein